MSEGRSTASEDQRRGLLVKNKIYKIEGERERWREREKERKSERERAEALLRKISGRIGLLSQKRAILADTCGGLK
ncbi:MAG: hypothetical protein EA390_00595 [Balneolaceae bacterium]|nr:MAG: hypothetical protein EA390_00595 [Balneolaceae bacterium]